MYHQFVWFDGFFLLLLFFIVSLVDFEIALRDGYYLLTIVLRRIGILCCMTISTRVCWKVLVEFGEMRRWEQLPLIP